MRRIWLLAIVFISINVWAQFHPPYTYWKVHRIRSGDWLYKLSRELRQQGVVVVSLEDLVGRILKKNPHIKNRDRLEPGVEILIPYGKTPTVAKKNGTPQIIHNHYYYNAKIYNGLVMTGEVESPVRAPTSFAPPRVLPKNKVSTKIRGSVDSGPSTWFATVEPFYQFTRLNSQENNTGLKAQLASESSTGIGVGAGHNLFEDIDIIYFASFTSENFIQPNTALPTANFDQTYFQVGSSLLWKMNLDWVLKPYLSLREKAYIQVETAGLSVSKVAHPVIGVDSSYRLLSWSDQNLSSMIHLSYFLSGSQGDLEVGSGFSYGAGVSYGFPLWGEVLASNLWMRFHDTNTQTASQTSQDLSLSLSWNTHF